MKLLIAVLLLSGCVSQQQVDAQRAYDREQFQSARLARLENNCRLMGFPPGTPDFRQCMLQLHSGAQQQDTADRAIILQHLLNRR